MRDLSEEPSDAVTFHAPLATDVGVWSVSSFVMWIHFLHLFKITMQPQSTVKKNKTSPYFSPAPDNFDHESNKKYTFISIHDQIIHLPVN